MDESVPEFWVVFATLTLVLLYGINLYFSTNGNINDPIVPVLWPLLKDAVLASAIGAYCIVHRQHLFFALREPVILCLLLLTLSVSALALLRVGLDRETASLAKNSVLYQFLGGVVGFMVASRLGVQGARWCVVLALYVALIVSFLLLFHPVQSLDGRAYGTFGNPTSLGFAAVILMGLAIWRGSAWECVAASVAAGLTYLLTGSLSVVAAVALVTAGGALADFTSGRRLGMSFWAGVIFVAVVFAACVVGLAGYPTLIGAQRIIGFLVAPETVLTTDSVRIRAGDILAAPSASLESGYYRYDSYLLSLWRNFGPAPLLLYAGLLGAVTYSFVKAGNPKAELPIYLTLLALFVVNPMLQHQIEVFPTNALFSFVLGCAVFAFGARRREATSKRFDPNVFEASGLTSRQQ